MRRLPRGSAVKLAIAGVVAIGAVALVLFAMGVFESDGGSEESLGKIAFVRDGNIWVQELPDGTLYQLTDKGASSRPRWSPSGEWLLYANESGEDNRLDEQWVVRADGGDERRLGPEDFSSWWLPDTPEDRLLRMTSDRVTMTEAPDGSNPEVLYEPFVEGGELIARFPMFGAADTEREIYIEGRYDPDQDSDDRFWAATHQAVWSSERDGSNAVELLPIGSLSVDDEFSFLPFGLTPDESHLLALRMNQGPDERLQQAMPLLAVPTEGAEVRELGLETAAGASPATGEHGVVIVAGGPQETWTNKRLALLAPDASGFTFLTPADVAAITPAWSPDGELIAYVAAPDLGLEGREEALAQRRLWVVSPDGSGAQQLTDGEGFRDAAPMWSAGGRYILFARLNADDFCDSAAFDLVRYDMEDGSVERLVTGLPLLGTRNGLMIGECLTQRDGSAITGRLGVLSLEPVFDWWQPGRE